MSTFASNNTTSIYNRDEFLLNIANKLGRSQPLDAVERPAFKHHCHQAVMKDFTQDQLADTLKQYAQTSLGVSVVETTKSELQMTLREVCHQYCQDEHGAAKQGETIISASETLLNLVDPQALSNAHHTVHVWDHQAGYQTNITIAERAQIGIVMAEQALAESGTVVLYSDPKQGRAISLLPETSIFVVGKSTLLPRLTQATHALHQKAKRGERIPSCVNFISGPSSTADIELIKVVGVHGPVSATYVIVDDM
ncbi:LutC/YkgG family protein [Vibrio sp. TRT 21S02]|uniref:LutC/YkgG family protein n=1 Tax=Vibrio sp. TRT 21S02 TaxID=3418507 RepID=UPI003CF37DCF